MADLLVRDAVPRSIRGTPITAVARPASIIEASEIMRDAAARGDAMSFCGGATEIGLGYAPERVDLLLATQRLSRVIDYSPADLVIEAEAGMALAALAAVTVPHRQRLALDPPWPERATLGGVIATNAFGPRRMRFGTLRDHIVGITLVRADGTRVRGGGKVVKNVAGFDLPKLAVGSLGTLAMIATVTLRLHPLPESGTALMLAGCSNDDLRVLERSLIAAQLEPSAFIAERMNDGHRAFVLFEGFAAGVAEQSERFAELAEHLGRSPVRVAPETLERIDAAARTGDVCMHFSVPLDRASQLDREAIAPLRAALIDAAAVAYPALGIAYVSGRPDDPDAAVAALVRARAAAQDCGGHAVLAAANESVAERVDPYGALPSSLKLMRELKARFDPGRLLNRGRFVGRL
ncbi:MAG: FAD-binding oxidoreductase [Candidatus Eremiobacteraeota bacterium]|nr:FAD-binding oxidoreductase [Candidatus Eremiobacteraeota bacterium]MBC5802892.1 FAD-binding oxidoreductase [Candidatus Eremiobacteraeota bacterium]MBC5821167.1 FAD-binding oxidoreductase [Candidatus Eremiobacteraeota bacterium]